MASHEYYIPVSMPDTAASAVSNKILRLDLAQLALFLDNAFPAAARAGLGELIRMTPGLACLRLDPTPEMLRPGNIVSGPTLTGLADVAAYALP